MLVANKQRNNNILRKCEIKIAIRFRYRYFKSIKMLNALRHFATFYYALFSIRFFVTLCHGYSFQNVRQKN